MDMETHNKNLIYTVLSKKNVSFSIHISPFWTNFMKLTV